MNNFLPFILSKYMNGIRVIVFLCFVTFVEFGSFYLIGMPSCLSHRLGGKVCVGKKKRTVPNESELYHPKSKRIKPMPEHFFVNVENLHYKPAYKHHYQNYKIQELYQKRKFKMH